jgi:hypothetical protein
MARDTNPFLGVSDGTEPNRSQPGVEAAAPEVGSGNKDQAPIQEEVDGVQESNDPKQADAGAASEADEVANREAFDGHSPATVSAVVDEGSAVVHAAEGDEDSPTSKDEQHSPSLRSAPDTEPDSYTTIIHGDELDDDDIDLQATSGINNSSDAGSTASITTSNSGSGEGGDTGKSNALNLKVDVRGIDARNPNQPSQRYVSSRKQQGFAWHRHTCCSIFSARH